MSKSQKLQVINDWRDGKIGYGEAVRRIMEMGLSREATDKYLSRA